MSTHEPKEDVEQGESGFTPVTILVSISKGLVLRFSVEPSERGTRELKSCKTTSTTISRYQAGDERPYVSYFTFGDRIGGQRNSSQTLSVTPGRCVFEEG